MEAEVEFLRDQGKLKDTPGLYTVHGARQHVVTCPVQLK